MSAAEDIVFEEREHADEMKIPVIALIKTFGDGANVIFKFWYGDVDSMYNEYFEFRFNCGDAYCAALNALPDLENMFRNYVVHRIYTEDGPIIIHCVRKEIMK